MIAGAVFSLREAIYSYPSRCYPFEWTAWLTAMNEALVRRNLYLYRAVLFSTDFVDLLI